MTRTARTALALLALRLSVRARHSAISSRVSASKMAEDDHAATLAFARAFSDLTPLDCEKARAAMSFLSEILADPHTSYPAPAPTPVPRTAASER